MPQHGVDVFRTYYGPVHKAVAALDGDRRQAFELDRLALLRQVGGGRANGLVVPLECLETVITR